jgi:hypothetical protein
MIHHPQVKLVMSLVLLRASCRPLRPQHAGSSAQATYRWGSASDGQSVDPDAPQCMHAVWPSAHYSPTTPSQQCWPPLLRFTCLPSPGWWPPLLLLTWPCCGPPPAELALDAPQKLGSFRERCDVRYNYACTCALAGIHQAAAEQLALLHARGALQAADLAADEDLLPLRQYAWFQDLLQLQQQQQQQER